jgi:hypothetical protein
MISPGRSVNRWLAALLVLGLTAPAAAQPGADVDPRVAGLVAAVSAERLAALVKALQGFETRHTLSSAGTEGRGIAAAADWIAGELRRASPRLQVSFDTYDVPAQGQRVVRDVTLRNVMAVLPGRSPRRIYVSAHYDSLARRPRPATSAAPEGAQPARPPEAGASPAAASDRSGPSGGDFDWGDADGFAPGANDDGSGTAVVMELARVFAQSGVEFDATLVFIAFAGEEQGLVGAKLHAQRAEAERLVIDAVYNNDIVGNAVGGQGRIDSGSVRVFSEGPEDSPSRQLARFIRRQAARYVPGHVVRLVARHDRFGRGGDHTAFNQHGYAAVRVTEANENYARQHTVEDTADGVSPAYLAQNARVNAAAMAVQALAPPSPRVNDERGRPMLDREPSGYDARLRWAASPGAVAYRVFWREAWTPDWQHEMVVGHVTEAVLPGVSIDDYVFGVAAIGPDGHESVVAAYVNPPRTEFTIRTR